jgi:hypothetical protein
VSQSEHNVGKLGSDVHVPRQRERDAGGSKDMSPVLDRLQRTHSRPNNHVWSKIIEYLGENPEVDVMILVSEISRICSISEDDAMYQVWALIERGRLHYGRRSMVSLSDR